MITVSFDLDGVILRNPFGDWIAPRMRADLRGAPALAGLPPEEADRRAMDAFRDASVARMKNGEHAAAYDLDGLYAEICRGFGREPALDIAALYQELCQGDGLIALTPGAREALEQIRAAGIRIIAVTNGYRAYQWPQLEALRIDDYFAALVTPEVAGTAKPYLLTSLLSATSEHAEPPLPRRADAGPGGPDARLLRSVDGLAAHVGDMLLADVLGANLAGIRSVWLDDALPDDFRGLAPPERVQHPRFSSYVEAALARSFARDLHMDATVGACLPDVVVTGMSEVAEVLVGWFGTARQERAA